MAAARRAWLAGEFARCLELLDGGIGSSTSEAILVRARSLLRLDRPNDALTFVRSTMGTHHTADAQVTARMLEANAVTRGGNARAGLLMLDQLARDAAIVHPTIRSEIAYNRGLAYWMLGRHDLARAAVSRVSGGTSDIVGAWCESLIVFIDIAEHRLGNALEHAFKALKCYRACSARDRHLEAAILVNLAIVASEIPIDDAAFEDAERAIGEMTWSEDLRRHGTLALTNFSWVSFIRGDEISAMRYMREALETAPSAAWRVHVLAERAILYRLLGQELASLDHVAGALSLARTVAWSTCSGEESLALLTLAEAAVATDIDAAAHAYETYVSLDRAMMPDNALHRDEKVDAYHAYLRGSLAVASGRRREGVTELKQAYALFRKMNYHRRSVEVAAALSRVPHRGMMLDEPGEIGEGYYRAWAARLMPEPRFTRRDARFESLTSTERDVLRIACEGIRPERIGERLGSKTRTVYNHLAAIRRKYQVTSHAALLAACAQGVTPSVADSVLRSRAGASTGMPATHRSRHRASQSARS